MFEDYDSKIKWGWRVGIGAMVVVVVGMAMQLLGYQVVKQQPQIRWLDQPVTQERDADGKPVAVIVLGFDDKGFVHWGRAPMPPAQTPQPAPTKNLKDMKPIKPEAKHGKP